MGFYTSIAEVYDQIFPLNPGQIAFTEQAFVHPEKQRLLDIGCGTGSLSLALSDRFASVTGIDLDEEMLKRAKMLAENKPHLEYRQMDMLKMDTGFEAGSFEGIVCFGNTLVHLPSPEQITLFFKSCFRLLAPGGKLLIQLIHYDRILDQQIDALPTISNQDIQFVRNYHYLPTNHSIDFETILTIRETGQVIRNQVSLFPLRKSEMTEALRAAGFKELNFFGSFKREALGPDSLPLIVEAS